MQIAEVLALPPACCFVCKKGDQAEPNKFIDTLRFETNGNLASRLYICFECVEEAAGLHGFVAPKAAQGLKDQIAELEWKLGEKEQEVEALEDVRVALGILKPKKPSKVAAAPKAAEE